MPPRSLAWRSGAASDAAAIVRRPALPAPPLLLQSRHPAPAKPRSPRGCLDLCSAPCVVVGSELGGLSRLAHLELSTVEGVSGLQRAKPGCNRHAVGTWLDQGMAPPCASHLPSPHPADDGPLLERDCLPHSLSRLCLLPAPTPPLVGAPQQQFGAQLPEMLLQLPRLVYLDVSGGWAIQLPAARACLSAGSRTVPAACWPPARALACLTRLHPHPHRVESLFADALLDAALPRLTRLTSLALDKCELGASGAPGSTLQAGWGCRGLSGAAAGASFTLAPSTAQSAYPVRCPSSLTCACCR